MSTVCVSRHAASRFEERSSFRPDKVQSYAERAWKNGKSVEDYSGKKRRYLEDIRNRYDPDHRVIKTHANFCYIFSDTSVLITVYLLDEMFFKSERRKERRIRDDEDEFVVA